MRYGTVVPQCFFPLYSKYSVPFHWDHAFGGVCVCACVCMSIVNHAYYGIHQLNVLCPCLCVYAQGSCSCKVISLESFFLWGQLSNIQPGYTQGLPSLCRPHFSPRCGSKIDIYTEVWSHLRPEHLQINPYLICYDPLKLSMMRDEWIPVFVILTVSLAETCTVLRVHSSGLIMSHVFPRGTTINYYAKSAMNGYFSAFVNLHRSAQNTNPVKLTRSSSKSLKTSRRTG